MDVEELAGLWLDAEEVFDGWTAEAEGKIVGDGDVCDDQKTRNVSGRICGVETRRDFGSSLWDMSG
jgi:hypothetical protein